MIYHGEEYKYGQCVQFPHEEGKQALYLKGTITSFSQSKNDSMVYASILVSGNFYGKDYFGVYRKPLYILTILEDE
jgi:hypothetical protein